MIFLTTSVSSSFSVSLIRKRSAKTRLSDVLKNTRTFENLFERLSHVLGYFVLLTDELVKGDRGFNAHRQVFLLV